MADLDIERGQRNNESIRGSADGSGPLIVSSAPKDTRRRGAQQRLHSPRAEKTLLLQHPYAGRRLEGAD